MEHTDSTSKTGNMKGTVYKVNGDMIALKVDENDFTIIEVSTDEFEVGEEVTWDADEGLGSGTVYNLSQDEEVDVMFQNHNVQNGQLAKQLTA